MRGCLERGGGKMRIKEYMECSWREVKVSREGRSVCERPCEKFGQERVVGPRAPTVT